jgi:hypothetical protein
MDGTTAGNACVNVLKRLSQLLAILCLAFLLGMIAHKGYSDISALARQHSGEELRLALARYFLGNLAGGGKPASK